MTPGPGNEMPPDTDSIRGDHDSRLDRIDELFTAVYALGPDDRARFLDEACAGDPSLRSEVEHLLVSLGEPLALLTQTERGPSPGSALSTMPERIGEYCVLEVLGRGGMAVVYRAEQSQPRRDVALKVLLPSDDGTDGLQRLYQEAEILGRLQHPGIAQIFGAGSYESALGKQPYLAMELIEGKTLLEHCDQQRLDVRARCELMVMVAEAVQHAHDRGVIHRDLKPSNVMVATHLGDHVQPKVLDFGVARMSDPTGQRARTMQSGEVVGTLTYMSPEQFLHGHASERSDVYSLGVMLYELISGRVPFDFKGRSIRQIYELLSEVEPNPLPRSVGLPADLRTIVSRALAKDSGERYPSAAELAAELRRWLADEPILARPLTFAYRLSKFARRNRAFVAGMAATALALMAGTVVALTLLVAARKATAESRQNEYESQLRSASSLWRTDPIDARNALDLVRDRAGLEWRLLAARLDPFVLTCPTGDGHPEDAERRAVVCSADGKRLFFHVSSEDHIGHLHDAESGQELWQIGLGEVPEGAGHAVFSRSGELLATTAADPRGVYIVVMRTADARIVHRIELEPPDSGSTALLWVELAFTADERFLVWNCSSSERGISAHARSIELATGSTTELGERKKRAPLTPHFEGSSVWFGHRVRLSAATGDSLDVVLPEAPGTGPARVFVHPSGAYYASVRTHFNVLIHDALGNELLALNGLRARPRKALIQRDMVAATTLLEGGGMRVWDLRSGQSLRGLPTDAIEATFDSDGSRLLAVTAAGAGWIDLAQWMRGHSDFIIDGALHPQGELLATADERGQVRLWELDTETCCGVLELGRPVDGLAFEADGRGLWCRLRELHGFSAQRVDLVRWRLGPVTSVGEGGVSELIPASPQAVLSAARRPRTASITCGDGREVICRALGPQTDDRAYEVTIPLPDGTIATHRLDLPEFPLPTKSGPTLAVDPDERWLAVGLKDGSLTVFELDSGRICMQSRRHVGAVLDILILPDQDRLVSAGFDGTLRFWELDSWREVYSERGHERSIEGMVTTPDHSRLVTWSADRTVRIWDTLMPSERHEALTSQAAPRRAADDWVDRLWDELGDADRVAERIEAEVPPCTERWHWVLERQLKRLAATR